jgi:hypothetical protein
MMKRSPLGQRLYFWRWTSIARLSSSFESDTTSWLRAAAARASSVVTYVTFFDIRNESTHGTRLLDNVGHLLAKHRAPDQDYPR